MRTVLETIYKKAKTGKIVYTRISHDYDQIIVETGQVGTSNPIFHYTICKPKNVGKSNETSGSEQAELEAIAKHAKKIKSGYVLDPSGETDVRLPMKVKTIQDQWNNIVYPCISTPKLNGVNGTYRLKNGKLNLTSRGGDPRPEIPHLTPKIIHMMIQLETNEINVELYLHGQHLQDLSSAVTKTNELSSKLQAGIFDIADTTLDYILRRDIMIDIESMTDISDIYFLNGVTCYDKADIENHYNRCIDEGLEGTVVKNYTGLYKHNERSSDQFKYKKALDAEYIIIGYKLDKHNHAVFECYTDHLLGSKGTTFKVKMKGTNPERLKVTSEADKYIGKWMKIEYETLSKDNKPLKPVGIAFRECDTNGNPIE